MKTSATFSILFWLKQSKAKNGDAPLYARLTVNGKRAEISLKRKIKIANWNAAKNKVKGTNQEARTINEYLNQVQKGIIQSKNELTLENKFITSQAIKSRYLKEDEQNHTLNDIINYHNKDMINKLKWGTQKNYFTTQKYISKFLKKQFNTLGKILKQCEPNC